VRVARVDADVAAPQPLRAQHASSRSSEVKVWPNTSRPQPHSSVTSDSTRVGQLVELLLPARRQRGSGALVRRLCHR
jgi:hypothetical protein